MRPFALFLSSFLFLGIAVLADDALADDAPARRVPPADLAEFFRPPEKYRDDFGTFRSPLLFADGTKVQSAADWPRRRQEIRATWERALGRWPELIARPTVETVATTRREEVTQHQLRLGIGLDAESVDAFLLVPDGPGPFPGVVVAYYDAQTGVGLGTKNRDYGWHLAKRGFVALSIGKPNATVNLADSSQVKGGPYLGPPGKPARVQPIAALAYAAANAHTVLAQRPDVDAERIGIVGHSFGGKWALFASCLYEKFACAVWSDPGIVFDERDRRKENPGGSVNYWDVWYLGLELGSTVDPKNAGPFRKLPSEGQARTGAYKQLVEAGHDLVELHALMAPRPFLVSGGTADMPERWPALNHAIAVNRLLGHEHRVAMTNRAAHGPSEADNEQVYRFFEWWLKPAPVRLASAKPAARDARPNVLFIMADDLRAELASYGSPALTPNLSRLARRGVQFDRAYCQQAVCNPSRSSLLTGRRPDTLRVWNNSTHFREPNPDVTTLPLWFKEHGYVTRCVGKIFHNWHTQVKGDPRSWSAPEFLHYANHGDDLAQVTGPLPPNHASTTGGFGYEKPGICECRDVPDEAYYDGRVAAEAVRVLGEVQDRPFFLAVGFWKPHAHFNAPKRYWDLYDRAKLPPLDPRRPAGAPDLAFHQSTEVLGPVDRQKPVTPAQAAEMRHGYFANISYMDAQLGKVLDALDRSGVADRTIVTFISDHGYHVGEHTLWGKTSNFEYDARVPMLIRAPGVSADGQRTTALAELLDLFPTLAALCGLPRPEGLEGTSLEPVLRDPTRSVKPAAFTQHPRPAYYDRTPSKQPAAMGVSVRTSQVRYTEWRDWQSGRTVARELYADADEPAETRSVLDAPELAADQREAERLLRERFPEKK